MSDAEWEMRFFVIMAADGKFDDSGEEIHLKGVSHDLLHSSFQKHGCYYNDEEKEKLKAISKHAATKQNNSAEEPLDATNSAEEPLDATHKEAETNSATVSLNCYLVLQFLPFFFVFF